MKSYPKPKLLRDANYLKWLRTQPPLIKGLGETVCHHLKMLGGGGTGTKPPDNHAIPLSDSVHKDVHQYGERRVCERYGYFKENLKEICNAYYRVYSRSVTHKKEVSP